MRFNSMAYFTWKWRKGIWVKIHGKIKTDVTILDKR